MDRTITRGERVALVVTVLVLTAVFAWLQFSFAGLYDTDSYFHTRAAEQLASHGIERTFPQAAFSTWAERYSDKDFLFHVLLIPFVAVFGDLTQAGKVAVVFFDLALFAALAGAAAALRLRFAPLWMILFATAHPFVQLHLTSVRPHTLGTALLLIEIVLLLRPMPRVLLVVAALHVWTHSSFVLLPLVVAGRLAASLVSRETPPWRLAGAAVAGIALGSVVHPYFPNNLAIAFDQTWGVASQVWTGGTKVPTGLFGAELLPIPISYIAQHFAPVWLPVVVGCFALSWAAPRKLLKTDVVTLAFLCAGFLALSLLSQRTAVLFVLLAVLLSAAVWTELAGGRTLREAFAAAPIATGGALALFLGCLVAGSRFADMRETLVSQRDAGRQRNAVAFLEQNAAPGEGVYHATWTEFSLLYHFRPDGRYVYGLDPIFFYEYDESLFRKNLRLLQGRARDPFQIVARDFGAAWVYLAVDRDHRALFALLSATPGFRRVFLDDDGAVFAVEEPESQAPERQRARPGRPFG